MSLVSKLAFQVDKTTQARGYYLFRAENVISFDGDAISVSASVQGERVYQVEFRYEQGTLKGACSCPAFSKFGPCKHMWAVLLEADTNGALADARAAARLPLGTLFDFQPEPDLPDVREYDEAVQRMLSSLANSVRRPKQASPPPRRPVWEEQIESLVQHARQQASTSTASTWPNGFEVYYVIEPESSQRKGNVVLRLISRNRKKNGEWSVFKDLALRPEQAATLPDSRDGDFVVQLHGSKDPNDYSSSHYYYGSSSSGARAMFVLPTLLAEKLLPQMAALGRLWISPENYTGALRPAYWDDGPPWRFQVRIHRNDRDLWQLTGELIRGEERLPLAAPEFLLPTGLMLHENKLTRFADGAATAWVKKLMETPPILFPDKDRDRALSALLSAPVVPELELSKELEIAERNAEPRFGLRISEADDRYQKNLLKAVPLVDYGDGMQPARRDLVRANFLPAERVLVRRNLEAEQEAWEFLRQAGVRIPADPSVPGSVPERQMPKVVRDLLSEGWHVEAHGKLFRRGGAPDIRVASGIDWFEVHGEVQFEGEAASLPELLAAMRRGDGMVKLGDGSFGILPEEWLQRFAPLANLGRMEDGHLRFKANQAAVLDVLLAAQPEVRVDEVFARARERLRAFHGVEAAPQPKGFQGTLRHYQLEGLGWIHFLRDFGFGGVLADDMGVGKTAQVLAALLERKQEGHGPTLVVAPRSLMFNWREEAARFTPELQVLEHTGITRDAAAIDDANLVLTTYGTVQRDAALLSKREFDYVILDEAQAIKNASTATAKAVRLLKAKHRLALSGTPVENHLGELWSLFEFLNPGMLGEAKALKLSGGLARNPSPETRQLLGAALRPFILRRTKKQVAKELPEKTEQTIYCEMEGDQLRKYNELREHYRARLLGKGRNNKEWNKVKLQVLEALLRLRQAACHPGLLDEKLQANSSAKFQTLLPQLEELRGEGHKALIFSQFTSLLGLLRAELDARGFRYEYLDGATRDRQDRVQHFQNDTDCQLFLISLRAGGVGLNLTAAGYVFLLDPWWNPAVEAQAIDRAHRIGQTQNVFAYRLIAKGSVEEKVLDLQKSKRELADAILSEDNSVIRDLTREDLELLLS